MVRRAAQVVVALLLVPLGIFAAATVVDNAESATPSCSDLLAQSYAKFQPSSPYRKWKQQNPNEAIRVEGFWADGGTAPVVATLFGQALVLEKQGQIACSSAPPPPTTTAPPVTTTTPPPPPAGSANLWIDTNGGSCTRTTTPGAYSDSAACASMLAAYAAASSGDVVGVRDGSYPTQKFAGGYQSTQPSGTKILTFRGGGSMASGGPNFRQIHFGSPNLTFDGINTDAGGAKTTGATFENGGESFLFKNGRIGNVIDEKAALVTGSGIVFDKVFFHDAKIVTAGVHLECIWAGVPEGMIVRNSRFERCDVMDIFFVYPDYWNPLPPPYGNVTLENNWFGHPAPGYSLYIAKNGVSIANQTPMSGWRVRNNYVEPGSYGVNNDQPVGANNVFCGNTGERAVGLDIRLLR